MHNENCETCRYRRDRQCRRNPPQIIYSGTDQDGFSDINAFFPWVEPTHWCGEYKAVDPEVIVENFSLLELVDGAYDIVELWAATTPAQKIWKKNWLAQARKHGAVPSPYSNNWKGNYE